MKPKKLPSKDYLHSVFSYDKKTGNLYWKKHKYRSRMQPGDLAGRLLNTNRYQVWLDGKQYMRSRIVAKMFLDNFSDDLVVDHINGITNDDRLSNLRMVSLEENSKNIARSVRNKSGCTGVCWRESKKIWRVSIVINGKNKEIGRFKDLKEAIDVRKKAEKKYGYHKNHGRDSAILS